MNIKKWLFFCTAFFSITVFAGTTIDVFGTTPTQAEQIVKKYGKRVGEIEDALFQTQLHPPESEEDKDKVIKLLQKRMALADEIKQFGSFLYADVQTISYENQQLFTTIEVVRSDQAERLRYTPSSKMAIEGERKHDLVEQMNDYLGLMHQLFITNELAARDEDCPGYHCLPGLNHPKLKPYLKTFTKQAPKQRETILQVLNHDPDQERRAAAAFLVGYFKDPNDIIALLSQHIGDSSPMVRNNALRVMGETIQKSKVNVADMQPILAILHSPETTDRNKALLVVDALAADESNHQVIKQQAGKQLINILQLKQLNNHRVAYRILKKISKQSFDEYDIAAWDGWLKKESTSV